MICNVSCILLRILLIQSKGKWLYEYLSCPQVRHCIPFVRNFVLLDYERRAAAAATFTDNVTAYCCYYESVKLEDAEGSGVVYLCLCWLTEQNSNDESLCVMEKNFVLYLSSGYKCCRICPLTVSRFGVYDDWTPICPDFHFFLIHTMTKLYFLWFSSLYLLLRIDVYLFRLVLSRLFF